MRAATRNANETALITGASSGIGEALAACFAKDGFDLVLVARSAVKLEALAASLAATHGVRTRVQPADLAQPGAAQALAAALRRKKVRVDILVNNAGVIEPISEIATSDPQAWANSITINLIGAYNVVRAVLPDMLAKGGGTIVNVSSGAAYRPLEGWSAYCAGKAGLAMLTRSIELETKGKGIRVFGFSPGTIDTEMQVKIRASGMNMISQIPRANLSPVEHGVRGLVHLCTAASDDLIGQDASMRDDAFRGRIGLAS